MFFKIQNPKVSRKSLQKCSQFIASSSQNSQKARGKIASTSAVKKNPSKQKFKMAKTFWLNTAYYEKVQRCSIAEDRDTPIRERHFNCLFPERSAYAELLLCDWPINFIILTYTFN